MDNNKLIPINSSVALAKTSVALSITDKLTFNQNQKMVKEIFLSNKEFFINIISRYYPLIDEMIEKYQKEWNWYKLSQNDSLFWTEILIEKYIDKWDLRYLSWSTNSAWIESFIEKYIYKWNWEYLSENKSLPWSETFIEKYIDEWNWVSLSSNESLPWTEKFIDKYTDKWNWGPYWDMYGYRGLSGNESLPWSEAFIEKHIDKWSWKNLSGNTSLPWSENLIDKYIDKWDREILCWNKSLPWTDKFVEKYNYYLLWEGGYNHTFFPPPKNIEQHIYECGSNCNWGELSRDTLPWSEELIDKYIDKWDWKNIFSNKGIKWDLNMLTKYIEYYNKCGISTNVWNILKPFVDDKLIEDVFEELDKK